ncbi:tRNA (adenosine(37)-N6)-threonylcarbamoyltransferase complex dimerization subunit type 1 TsaB [Rhizobium sp. FKY42]|uniref:tRNA (adenosine(37)-N6)-threonylcarbamoyltransferase complex dimerization subunit type 1 TsaB n=1 Tax=Rhizobium sp. FKY42 TaxID=2562310 RepID=UPI0010BFFBE3|nr:tRNA (adenosine(37)-N6)-threonylcarbamoyltransferase complex dimerization subunit type 1 TsaB [Rhizobium sp. FKY42]
MKLLAIDTAGVDCSAAVLDATTGQMLSVVSERIGKGHAERLMAMVEEAVGTADVPLSGIERIGVTIGPGSFTGIRVGVAAARGFGLALGVETVGVSTLHTLAQMHLNANSSHPVIAAMDAKRDEIYAQVFAVDGKPLTSPQSIDVEQLRRWVDHFGAKVTGTASALLDDANKTVEPDRFDIATVARLAALADVAVDLPKPLYLRGPDAKPQDGFALLRA